MHHLAVGCVYQLFYSIGCGNFICQVIAELNVRTYVRIDICMEKSYVDFMCRCDPDGYSCRQILVVAEIDGNDDVMRQGLTVVGRDIVGATEQIGILDDA